MPYSPSEVKQIQGMFDQWKQSPIVRHYSFSDKKLWSKQEEILWSVRNNKRTAVKSGNTVGKSFISADVVMDWLTTHYPAKVITTASSWTQVEQILWKEIRLYCKNAKIPIGAEPLSTALKINDEHFAMGISVDTPVRMQGFHSENLLVVIDEPQGVRPEVWEMVDALHPKAVLVIGNPLEAAGKFYECFNSNLWHKLTINCEDCVKWQEENFKIPGLVTREWIEEQKQEHGVKSPWYQIHVLGEFPTQTPDTLISREWVEKCRKQKPSDIGDNEEDDPKLVPVDVATKHGENLTVIGYRYGHSIIECRGYKQSITDSANRVSFKYNEKQADISIVDSDGVGEGLSDILAERKIPNIEFHGGSASKAMDDKKFRNLRSQFFWLIAKKFEKGLYSLSELPDGDYEILKNQLCAIHTKAPDPMGRFQIETKDDMMARGVKSPDFADCFMMGEFGFFMNEYADIAEYKYR